MQTTEENGTARAWWVARAIGAALLVAYFIQIIRLRMEGAWAPYSLDGDQAQAVFQYWRYHVDGALRPGHLLTDYAFVMHAPPGWWALMATLSSFVEPLMAAKVLQILAWALLTVAVVVVVGKRTEWLLGMAAAVLVLRSPDLMSVAAGGYARSFGPFLIILFLGAFISGRHRLVLAVLVLQAALYPSVVVPSALTYGAYCVIRGPMRERLRRSAGMFVAGLLIIAFGKYQDIQAPDWWGSVVTYAEAEAMPAWRVGGRVPDVPHKPPVVAISQNAGRGFRPQGEALAPMSVRATFGSDWRLLGVPALFAVVAIAIDRIRHRRRGTKPDEDARFPWQVVALFAGAIAGYFVARVLAFKLYLPARQLAHTIPYLLQVGLPLLIWCGARVVVGKRRAWATAIAVGLAVVPVVVVRGDGLGRGSSYKDFGADRPLWEAVRKLPLDAEIACDHYVCDNLGLFTYHHPYANRTLTHPFRKGYYEEAERRLVEMSRALYATSWSDFAAFAEREKVDYFVYTTLKLKAPERRMYRPAKDKIDPIFRAAASKPEGMVLARPPAEAVVFRYKTFIVLDLHKVLELQRAGRLDAPSPIPASAPSPAP